MADDRANNPSRQPNLPYKGLEGKKNIASVSLPSRNEDTPGSNKWDFGGGRLQVSEYNKEELGPREMTKFDKNNKYHVGMLTATDDSNKGMMVHEGGYFSFPKKEAAVKTEGKGAPKKAVAPKKDGAAPKKKMSNLEKARAAEDAARKSKKL
jgi:hypothetical protein